MWRKWVLSIDVEINNKYDPSLSIMAKLSKLYKSLSDNQRYNFWIAATNLFLCMFTFWLGVTVQFVVVDKTTDYQSKLMYREYEKYITPQYNNLLRAISNVTKIIDTDTNKLKEMLSRSQNGKITEEDNKYMANLIDVFVSDHDYYMSYIDTIVNNAMSLKYVLPKDKQHIINSYCRDILVKKIAVEVLLESNSIDDFSNKVKAYFSSDKFINNTRMPLNSNMLKVIDKEIASVYILGHIQGTERIGLVVYHDILDKVLKISTIYNDELGYFGKNKDSIGEWWNGLSLLNKSFIVLLCTIIIGAIFCTWFLGRLSLPSDPDRNHTAEEYRNIKKERDVLHNLVIANADTMDGQKEEIKDLKDKVEDLKELNFKYYKDIENLKKELVEYYKMERLKNNQ